ncbi:MAG: ARMT1-like domain-containing protein [Planctomycetota bacterium]
MKIDPECIPCSLRRILATASRISDDPWVHHKLLGNAMQELADVDRECTPAELMTQLTGIVTKSLGASDPYQQERKEWWDELESCRDKVVANVQSSKDPLRQAVLLATGANVFDDECLRGRSIRDSLRSFGIWGEIEGEQPDLDVDDVDLLRSELATAKTLLFVHDSGPELLFDRILVEQILAVAPNVEVTSVVRSQPFMLDATHEDLERSELLDVAGVVGALDPGIPTLGIPLDECSREFRERFESADLIIGKGQASYETMSDNSVTRYFSFRVKCAVMAKVQGLKVGGLVFSKA